MRKTLISIFMIIILIVGLFCLTACGNKENEVLQDNNSEQETLPDTTDNVGEELEATSDIDMETLSDEEKIEHALHLQLKETYGEDLSSAKIIVDKMYKVEETEKDDTLKSLNLGEKDIAFEVSIYLEPVKGADINKFTVPDGEYNEETGWVSEIYRLGVLRYNSENNSYFIDNYGTGW